MIKSSFNLSHFQNLRKRQKDVPIIVARIRIPRTMAVKIAEISLEREVSGKETLPEVTLSSMIDVVVLTTHHRGESPLHGNALDNR